MSTRFAREAAALALVALLCVATTLAARGTRRPFTLDGPEARRRGAADAKVLIVEFSDFQCPACRMAEPALKRILSLYDGKVRLVFKNYPLPVHHWARDGAVAAECAGRQGRFWDYHDRLYDRQEEWTNDRADAYLTGYAQALKLDMKSWQACRHDPSAAAAVADDVQEGENAWVHATPTFFINGRRFVGSRDLQELGTLFIDKELRR